jgi:hypothetical protein
MNKSITTPHRRSISQIRGELLVEKKSEQSKIEAS